MFKEKLTTLDCYMKDTFDPQDDLHYRNLILWLEDQKIRLYEIETRKELREVENPKIWYPAFKKYLADLKCPCKFSDSINDKNAVLEWLLNFAIRLESDDFTQTFPTADDEKSDQQTEMNNESQNPLDNLDFNDPEFKKGVEQIAALLNITRHPNHLITLKAINKLVKEKLSNSAIKEATENQKKRALPIKIKLEQVELGFDAGDYVLNNAAKILRMLHVQELRGLQTHINETIVDLQKISADPKTDERLGKIGI